VTIGEVWSGEIGRDLCTVKERKEEAEKGERQSVEE
jgi:hypothetical protein